MILTNLKLKMMHPFLEGAPFFYYSINVYSSFVKEKLSVKPSVRYMSRSLVIKTPSTSSRLQKIIFTILVFF